MVSSKNPTRSSLILFRSSIIRNMQKPEWGTELATLMWDTCSSASRLKHTPVLGEVVLGL